MARKFRTPAERMQAAKAEAAKLESQLLEEAINLRAQAQGWHDRSIELEKKSKGALAKANANLVSLDIDPAAFWAELDKDKDV